MKTQSRWALRVVGLLTLLFLFDVSFDSYLQTGHIDQQYISRDAWSHTPFFAIVCYVVLLGLIALGSLVVVRRTHSPAVQFVLSAAVAITVVALLRYAVHTFATIT